MAKEDVIRHLEERLAYHKKAEEKYAKAKDYARALANQLKGNSVRDMLKRLKQN